MILESKRHKMTLELKNDFEMKHAELLLKYQTYLLYDLNIKLESADAFIAINYFLEKLAGNFLSKLFRKVKIYIDEIWLDLYNKFITFYLNKGFEIDNLNTYKTNI